jgi:methylamine---glutamate N-methyltransferase subunit B
MTASVDCAGKEIREINREIKARIAGGATEIDVLAPDARHNLGVALLTPVTVRFHGSVGYYCAGLSDSPVVSILGSAGWGVAEGLMSGSVTVHGNAGNGAGAAMRGGTVVVRGDAGARAGASIKGGTLIIGGSAGYMTGFMGQKGTIIVCGDAEPGLGDSMYETVVYVGGEVAELGSDTVVDEPTPEEAAYLAELLTPLDLTPRLAWKKVASGRRLWNFDKGDAAWRSIL